MKKLFLIIFDIAWIPLCAMFFISSCKSIPVGTQAGQPEFSYDGKKICIKQSATATINQDSLLLLLSKGIKIGNDTNYIFVNYVNGKLSATGQGCLTIKK